MTAEVKDILIVQAEAMRRFCVAACKEVRLLPEHAELLADALVQADLRGVHTHGVIMLPYYVKGYQVGGINPRPAIEVVKEKGATAVMDGDNGLGLVVSHPAMRLAVEKATEHGVGTVVIRSSNHYGMAAYWSMMALESDMIGYTTTNAPPNLAPWGGVTRSYGNNPISYAIPAGKEYPIVLDIAMSVVAKSKIVRAALQEEPLPTGWAMDEDGEPTTDAHIALQGLLAPISGHKGYGIALVNDILSGVLSGGLFGTDIPEWHAGHANRAGYSHFFMALDVAHFMPVAEFKERIDKIVQMMKGSQLLKGQRKIYLPGELEFETRCQRIKEGIPYSKDVIGHLKKLAQDLHIPIDI
ncbi:Ldh family oxidoreductase [Chloroflexota bacterium]